MTFYRNLRSFASEIIEEIWVTMQGIFYTNVQIDLEVSTLLRLFHFMTALIMSCVLLFGKIVLSQG